MKKVDIGTGIGLIALSTWLFWYVGQYKPKEIYIYGPDFFPRLLAIMMISLSIFMIINALRGKSLPMREGIDPRGFGRLLFSVGICIGYLYLIKSLGFASATFIFLFTLMALLRQKGLTKRIFSSFLTSILAWAIMRYLLIIPLPEGLLL